MRQMKDYDVEEFLLGRASNLHEFFGSHLLKDKNGLVYATEFTVYAPNAKEVRLIAGFNQYEGWKHILTKIHHMGIWRIEIPQNLEWETYKYEIHTQSGRVIYKADPFAHFAEVRPQTASKVSDIHGYPWQDHTWFETKKRVYQEPFLIYEVHLGSWRRKFGAFKPYNEIVDELILYVKEQGFTHVELLH